MTRQDIDRIVRGLNFANVFCWSRANMATPGTDAAKLLMASSIACEDAAKLLDKWVTCKNCTHATVSIADVIWCDKYNHICADNFFCSDGECVNSGEEAGDL